MPASVDGERPDDVPSPRSPDINAIRTTAIAAAGCTALLLATTAACGTVENLTAAQKIDKAADRLAEQKSLSFELGLDATPAALDALTGDSGETALPPEAQRTLAKARVSVSVRSEKALSESDDKDLVGAAMKVSGPDGVLAEYRMAGAYYYYRMDKAALALIFGTEAPSTDELPEGAEAFKDILEGKWVKTKISSVKDAEKDARGKGDGAPSGGDGSKTQDKAMKAVRDVLARDVTFRDKGTEDGTEHISAEAPLRKLLTDLFDRLGPLTDELPPQVELPTADDLKDVPAKKVAVDFAIEDGTLSGVSVDLATLAEHPKGQKVPLNLKFGEAGDVSAPSGAREVPLNGSPFNSLASIAAV